MLLKKHTLKKMCAVIKSIIFQFNLCVKIWLKIKNYYFIAGHKSQIDNTSRDFGYLNFISVLFLKLKKLLNADTKLLRYPHGKN